MPGGINYGQEIVLLIAPTKNWDAAKSAAKDRYLADPSNPANVTTYALALAQAGKAKEARGLLETLPPAERDRPARAPYLAFVYAHCRRQSEFERYAQLAAKAGGLQEERMHVRLGQEALIRPLPRSTPLPKTPAAPATASKI